MKEAVNRMIPLLLSHQMTLRFTRTGNSRGGSKESFKFFEDLIKSECIYNSSKYM